MFHWLKWNGLILYINSLHPSGEDFFLKYINIFAYYRPQNGKIAALNLIFNGLRFFDGARIIKKFDLYKSMPTEPDTTPDLNTVNFFFEESIMDETRIIT